MLAFSGEYRDQLLCAIGKDEKDDMFPIAYAVVQAETRAFWEWFISILIDDIYDGNGEGRG
jgi:hypothetical protein